MATIVQAERATPPTYNEITRDIAATLGNPTRGYYILLGIVVTVLAIGVGALLYQVRIGLGVAGYTPPVMWGVYITTFVFWARRPRTRAGPSCPSRARRHWTCPTTSW